jgi:ribosomal-protein-alanine N-acetyltransferase
MTIILHSKRINLIAMSSRQLRLCLENPNQVELEFGASLSQPIFTGRVRRAIEMKLAKMEKEEESRHGWFTYWLIVIPKNNFGAGLVGFKGYPDRYGEVEIGYGIDPEYQKQGLMTEAVMRIMKWAFEDDACKSIVAIDVQKANLASQRVLQKAGMILFEESNETLSYRIHRDQFL